MYENVLIQRIYVRIFFVAKVNIKVEVYQENKNQKYVIFIFIAELIKRIKL